MEDLSPEVLAEIKRFGRTYGVREISQGINPQDSSQRIYLITKKYSPSLWNSTVNFTNRISREHQVNLDIEQHFTPDRPEYLGKPIWRQGDKEEGPNLPKVRAIRIVI